ncbi:hypothetical protein SAMN05421760_11645 [Neptunomonas antarctica]|uniref:Uncharacterized protein n=1 Tax=Neptunomonas antarctica TaxID=619304 RepID=A0A1N7PLV2_9GAMM|nr:hypothetical protein SAMN05421760_11645 [Neptunomonas antarctica]
MNTLHGLYAITDNTLMPDQIEHYYTNKQTL